MPSIIEGYNYDVFISYRQKDNKYDGWVTEFIENLNKELEATFKEEISVYFDINPRDGLLETHSVDQSLENRLKCLVFIPIISRTYCDPKSFAWQHELCAFNELAKNDSFGRDIKLTNDNVTSRILPVKIHDIDPEDKTLLEDELGGFLRSIEFIYKSPGVNRPLRANEDHPQDNLNKTYYRDQINKVANAIKDILSMLVSDFALPAKENTHISNKDERAAKKKIKKLKREQKETGITNDYEKQHADLQIDIKSENLQSIESDNIPETSNGEQTTRNEGHFGRRIFWGLILLLIAITAFFIGVAITKISQNRYQTRTIRFEIIPTAHAQIGVENGTDLAISPDGSCIVYVSRDYIYTRFLNSYIITPLFGTDGGTVPFFSPDGLWVGYFNSDEGQLMKVPLTGGAPVKICDAIDVWSANWLPNDTILFGTRSGNGIARVSANGGKPEILTTVDIENGEIAHDSPILLPEGKVIIFSIIQDGGLDESLIVAQNLTTGERKVLARGSANIQYVPTGHLVYNREGILYAAAFNPKKLEVGPWKPLEEGIRRGGALAHPAEFSFSDKGTLVYLHGWQFPPISTAFLDRLGNKKPLLNQRGICYDGTISPQGNRLAFQIRDSLTTQMNLWIYDVNLGLYNQLTFEGNISAPIWTPDGEYVTYISKKADSYGVYIIKWDGSSKAKELWSAETTLSALDWSPDGECLAIVQWNPETKQDIWIFSMQDSILLPFLVTSANETNPKYSANGEWIAYDSDDSGQREVYVSPNMNNNIKKRISSDGGFDPLWASNGQELYYQSDNKVMSILVKTELPDFKTSGNPQPLFGNKGILFYDIHPNEDTFLVGETDYNNLLSIRVVVNWFDELESRVPASEINSN